MADYIPIRLSHLLGYSGPGAVVRGPNSLMVVQDTSKWTDRDGQTGTTEIWYVGRVQAALKISQQLRTPPIAKELKEGKIQGVCVPATRFPRWMRCPKCGRLYPQTLWSAQKVDDPVCTGPADNNQKNCKGTRLEQVQYVMVHPKGYLADVPWYFLAHKGGEMQCRLNDKLRLLIDDTNNKLHLHCDACGEKTRFNDKEPQNFGNINEQPWLINKPVEESFRYDNEAKIRKINDSLVYSPVVSSALVIPPESRLKKGTIVDLLYRSASARDKIARLHGKTDLQRKSTLNIIARDYKCSIDDITEAIADIENGYPYYGKVFSDTQGVEDEYKAFLDESALPYSDDEDFVPRNYSARWQAFIESADLSAGIRNRAQIVQNLVKVDRLKEVRVFNGFTREGGETLVPPDISGQSGWLPAIELYGEGIFFTLHEKIISKWEKNDQVKERVKPIDERFAASGRISTQNLTARFLLLHTLSHLLIRQFEATGGYPAASLTERLYCSESDTQCPMSGILIYTSAPDKAGTLGGLAELASPERFLRILSQALDHAIWCSSDPVCSEHKGQGPGLLNLAACHACTLVPDTACAYNNILLDRVLVRGDRNTGLPSLFDGGLK